MSRSSLQKQDIPNITDGRTGNNFKALLLQKIRVEKYINKMRCQLMHKVCKTKTLENKNRLKFYNVSFKLLLVTAQLLYNNSNLCMSHLKLHYFILKLHNSYLIHRTDSFLRIVKCEVLRITPVSLAPRGQMPKPIKFVIILRSIAVECCL